MPIIYHFSLTCLVIKWSFINRCGLLKYVYLRSIVYEKTIFLENSRNKRSIKWKIILFENIERAAYTIILDKLYRREIKSKEEDNKIN